MNLCAHDIILRPIVTEHTMRGMQQRKYTFKVAKNANKIQIKGAVEELFGVKISKVNTLNCKGRYVRHRSTSGYRPDWKKAIVTLAPGSKTIEFFDNMF